MRIEENVARLRLTRRLLVCASLGGVLLLAEGCSGKDEDTPTSNPPRKKATTSISPPADPTKIGQEQKNSKDGAEMVWVPAGEFTMGNKKHPGTQAESEKPEHIVTLDGYWIYKNEVTVKQYFAFCDATGHARPKMVDSLEPDIPVVNVSWEDATAYCDWAGVSLPTEAQWEKAARGTDGREYPWGNTWDASKCVNASSEYPAQSTKSVGRYPSGASPYGCLDMAGNVWEWCYDWYDEYYYKTSPKANPEGPPTGEFRVMRGCAWNQDTPKDFRSSYRASGKPIAYDNSIGFRCVSVP